MLNLIPLFTLTYPKTEWGNALEPTWGLGVGQSVNTAVQPLGVHTLAEFFGQVSGRIGSATDVSWFYYPTNIYRERPVLAFKVVKKPQSSSYSGATNVDLFAIRDSKKSRTKCYFDISTRVSSSVKMSWGSCGIFNRKKSDNIIFYISRHFYHGSNIIQIAHIRPRRQPRHNDTSL